MPRHGVQTLLPSSGVALIVGDDSEDEALVSAAGRLERRPRSPFSVPRARSSSPDSKVRTAHGTLNGRAADYLMLLYTENSGRYIEITITPTMPPTKMIITGSRIDVSALTAASTSSS